MSYLGPRKLYIDSRYRASGSHSDFVFQLAQSIEVPHGMVAIVDTVSVCNTFQTIDATRDKLYMDVFGHGPQVVTLTTGMYNGVTLAAELQTQLNSMGLGTLAWYSTPALGSSAYCPLVLGTRPSVNERHRAPSTAWRSSGRSTARC